VHAPFFGPQTLAARPSFVSLPSSGLAYVLSVHPRGATSPRPTHAVRAYHRFRHPGVFPSPPPLTSAGSYPSQFFAGFHLLFPNLHPYPISLKEVFHAPVPSPPFSFCAASPLLSTFSNLPTISMLFWPAHDNAPRRKFAGSSAFSYVLRILLSPLRFPPFFSRSRRETYTLPSFEAPLASETIATSGVSNWSSPAFQFCSASNFSLSSFLDICSLRSRNDHNPVLDQSEPDFSSSLSRFTLCPF